MRTLKTDDARVKAIRQDPKVGWGSCTSTDECLSDQDLILDLDRAGIATAEDAVKWAHKMEGIHLEVALNARWGEDDDPQLLNWKEWNEGQ
jgi:hypothetical protein